MSNTVYSGYVIKVSKSNNGGPDDLIVHRVPRVAGTTESNWLNRDLDIRRRGCSVDDLLLPQGKSMGSLLIQDVIVTRTVQQVDHGDSSVYWGTAFILSLDDMVIDVRTLAPVQINNLSGDTHRLH